MSLRSVPTKPITADRPRILSLEIVESNGETRRFDVPNEGVARLAGPSGHAAPLSSAAWAAGAIELADATLVGACVTIERKKEGVRVVDVGDTPRLWLAGARIEAAEIREGTTLSFGGATLSLIRSQGDGAYDEVEDDARPIPSMIGSTVAMRRLAGAVRRYARLSAPVLVRGESGSGKELVARALHQLSPRAPGPFQAINLGALPRELAESELFGHERGAFTGALTARPGIFELCDGGTLLLDELGELPFDLQAKLLRVLETGEVRRLGGKQSKKVDVRIVAATWAPLERRIAEGTFREDLFHRIAVLVIDVPPLRERAHDIPKIANALLQSVVGEMGARHLTPAATSRLMQERWPGNVRELRNVVYRAAVLARDEAIEGSDVVRALSSVQNLDGSAKAAAPSTPPPSNPPPPSSTRLRQNPARAIEIVDAHGGSIAAAARACGLPRETLRDWVRVGRRQAAA